MEHIIIDNSILQVLLRNDLSSNFEEKRKNADQFATKLASNRKFVLLVPVPLIVEFLGFQRPPTTLLEASLFPKLKKVRGDGLSPSDRSHLISEIHESIFDYFHKAPEIQNFHQLFPMPELRDCPLSHGFFNSVAFIHHPEFARRFANFLAQDCIQTLIKPDSKSSTPDAAVQLLHALKALELDPHGDRCFPIKVMNSMIQAFYVVEKFWPPPHDLKLKANKDLFDSVYLDFAMRGWWTKVGRHPVTVYTCEEPTTVIKRCQAYKAIANAWKALSKSPLLIDRQKELIFNMRYGEIVCLDRDTYSKTRTVKVSNVS